MPAGRRVILSLSAAVMAVMVIPAAGTAYAGAAAGTASLSGAVTLGERLKPRTARVNLYHDVAEGIPATQPASLSAEMANVVISIEGAGLAEMASRPPAGASPEPLRIEQKHATFTPHVLPVLRGSVVEFPNADPYFHNVFSLSRAASFDLGRFPRSSSRSVKLDNPGIVKVYCHIHADMSAVIVVLDNPLFAIPDSSGRFRIDGIPPGEWTVTAWHERARPIRRTLKFGAGQDVDARFDIPLEDRALDE